MTLPNLIVAGVSKAGTTSLFDYLGRHPEIAQSDVKELRYFTPVRHGGPLEPVESYARHFRHVGPDAVYAMESTPGYFYGGKYLAQTMVRALGDVKVVVSLREPGDRCYSWFRFCKARVRIPKAMTFASYVTMCKIVREEGLDGHPDRAPYWGLGGGCYSEWLHDWSEVLGPDLRVVFFEDLVADPAGVVGDLFEWLKLDPVRANLTDLTWENKTEPYRNRALQRAAISVNRRGEQFFRAHPGLKRRLRGAYYTLNKAGDSDDAMTPEVRAELDEFYAPYNAVLGRDLADMGLTTPWAR